MDKRVQETINEISRIWVKNGLTLNDLIIYTYDIEEAIYNEIQQLKKDKEK